jgi:hypothetical protein
MHGLSLLRSISVQDSTRMTGYPHQSVIMKIVFCCVLHLVCDLDLNCSPFMISIVEGILVLYVILLMA